MANKNLAHQFTVELPTLSTTKARRRLDVHDFSRLKANYAEAFPAELPNELHNAIPEYFLVVDSGAQVHVLFDTLMLAHTEDGKQRMIKWGGKASSGDAHILAGFVE